MATNPAQYREYSRRGHQRHRSNPHTLGLTVSACPIHTAGHIDGSRSLLMTLRSYASGIVRVRLFRDPPTGPRSPASALFYPRTVSTLSPFHPQKCVRVGSTGGTGADARPDRNAARPYVSRSYLHAADSTGGCRRDRGNGAPHAIPLDNPVYGGLPSNLGVGSTTALSDQRDLDSLERRSIYP